MIALPLVHRIQRRYLYRGKLAVSFQRTALLRRFVWYRDCTILLQDTTCAHNPFSPRIYHSLDRRKAAADSDRSRNWG